VAIGNEVGRGNPLNGVNQPVDGGGDALIDGKPVPSGWLVLPHAGIGGLTAADVARIIRQGIASSKQTRSPIRLPLNQQAQMTFAVTDVNGDVLGFYRPPDGLTDAIGVTVEKARNDFYYASNFLQPQDHLPGVPFGVAFTGRAYRFLAQPRYPLGQDGTQPGPWSIINDGGVNPLNGLQVGPPLPWTAFQSVFGYDAFHPDTNFRWTQSGASRVENQNGVAFFPGGAAIYKNGRLVGGDGVSGEGVDQNDVETAASVSGYEPQLFGILRSDQVFFRGVKLPYLKFNRNPRGGVGEVS
jgi:uncharacterized protein GlcG (DUF336 family)